jgi:phytoene dehydrogenase-like protein
LQRLATRSYDELLREHIVDARCRRILSGQWPYIGVPPERLGALEGLMNIGGYLFQGAHYPRGGCQKVAEALGQRLEELGGKVLLRTAPRRVLVQGGAVCGVEVGPEQVVSTSCVVSAMDVGALLDMLPPEAAPLLQAQREQLRPSVSACLLYLGFSRQADLRPIPWGHHFFEEDFADWEGWMFLANPTASDPALAPNEGQILCCVLPYAGPYGPEQDWHAQKAQVAEKVLAYMEGRSPVLRQHLEVMETASPSTIWRYTGSQQGAIYGWAATVEQSGPRRMQPQTEVTGLFLAGHWTTPSSGVPGVAASGMLTAGLASDFLQP